MKDDTGVVQIWTVSPNGGSPQQLTRNAWPIASAFAWSPNGRHIGYVMETSICISDSSTGETTRLTPPTDLKIAPRPEACVFSPSGKEIAYVRPTRSGQTWFNQIFAVDVEP